MEETKRGYMITATTNPYIAQRDARFKGKTKVVIAEDMTLQEARAMLLSMLNTKFGTNYPVWDVAVSMLELSDNGEYAMTIDEEMRVFTYDSRTYQIEAEYEQDSEM